MNKFGQWKSGYLTEYTEEEQDEVCRGRLCPNNDCRSRNIKYMGSNYDGMSANHAFDCEDCGSMWEGY